MKIDFKSKGFTIIISVFFAVVFWAFAMVDGNTTRVSDVRNVAVHFRGNENLTERGLVVTNKSAESGTMRIEGGVNVVGYISNNNVNAYVDFSNITAPGEYEFAVNTFSNNSAVVVKSFSPAKIKITVEQYVEKQVPVEIVYDKGVPDNYWIDAAKVHVDRVKVAGGESAVQTVAKATVYVSTDRLIKAYEDNPNYNYEASLPVVYVDENNKEVTGIKGQSSIVSIGVLSKKNVPVDAKGAVRGNPANGYKTASVEQSITKVDIVGKKDVINSVKSLSVTPVNIGGARDKVVSNAKIKTADGVAVIGSSDVVVTVNIVPNTGN